MKHFSAIASTAALSAALMLPGMVFAGNIRQYTFKKGGPAYSELTDDVKIVPESWTPQTIIFKDGKVKLDAFEGEAFPIGFTFRYGGQEFDQFAPSVTGNLLLGKGSVSFMGEGGSFMTGASTEHLNRFLIGMSPINYGTRSGEISYKTEGEEGSKVLTVQFKDMILNETEVGIPPARCGRYNLQIRLYQATGQVQYAFEEVKTCTSTSGFYTGLHGWDDDDAVLMTATGLNNQVTVSEERAGNMLKPGTYIAWDADDAGNEYTPVFTFTPAADTPAPAQAPANLSVRQKGKSVIVKCDRAKDADYTVIMMSEKPFEEADLPVDGETMGSLMGENKYFAKGDAYCIFYNDSENPEVTLTNVAEKTPIYIRAYSANGYPRFSKEFAEANMTTTQNPPSSFLIDEEGQKVRLNWNSQLPVIVAVTTELGREGYEGVFGQPEADAAVGDEIEGGGKVIYAGDAQNCEYEFETPNALTLFSIWSIENGTVSSTGTAAHAVPAPTYPYEPALENYPYYETPEGWTNNIDKNGFSATSRAYGHERALWGASVDQTTLSFTSPGMPAATDAVLEFEYAVETLRDPKTLPDNPNVTLPQSNEPGWFGDIDGAGFWVSFGQTGKESELKRFTEYTGTMVKYGSEDSNDYESGSSTWVPVTIEIGDVAEGDRFSFNIKAQKSTFCYLRNIKLNGTAISGVTEIAGDNADGVKVAAGKGMLSISAETDCTVDVYNALGMHVAAVKASAGNAAEIALPAGIYVVAGKKVAVR